MKDEKTIDKSKFVETVLAGKPLTKEMEEMAKILSDSTIVEINKQVASKLVNYISLK